MSKRPIALFAMLFSLSSLLPIAAIAEGHPQTNNGRKINLTRGAQPDQTPGEGWQAGERHPMPMESDDNIQPGDHSHRPPPKRDTVNQAGHPKHAPEDSTTIGKGNHNSPGPKDMQRPAAESAENGSGTRPPFNSPPHHRPDGPGQPAERNDGAREIPPSEH